MSKSLDEIVGGLFEHGITIALSSQLFPSGNPSAPSDVVVTVERTVDGVRRTYTITVSINELPLDAGGAPMAGSLRIDKFGNEIIDLRKALFLTKELGTRDDWFF